MKLDHDERQILQAYEEGRLRSRGIDASEADRLAAIASRTLTKNRRVNIRLSEYDLDAIQRKAIQEGLPYQTLIASLIHKYTTGRLVEVR